MSAGSMIECSNANIKTPYPTRPKCDTIQRSGVAGYPILTQMFILSNMSMGVNDKRKMFK
jgi:hypothetical protein